MKRLTLLIAAFVLMSCTAQADDTLLDIQEIKTDSGITAWLAEDHSLPVIALTFTFLDSGTALDPADKQGLVRLLSNTMDEGAGDLDSQAFQKELADNSITLRFSAGRDGFGGNLKTLSRNKDKAFHLLQLALNNPRFDAEPVERMREANMARLRSSLSEPDWIAARILNDRVFEGHPYAMNSGGTLATMAAITADDLRHFQKTYLTRDRLLIAVSGDISAAELTKTLDTLFGTLPANAPANANVADTTLKNAGEISLFDQDIPQTIISFALPAFGRADPDYYPLKVMNYILGEAGFGSRLMEEIREKRGLTYGIYSDIQNYRHTDALTISTSTKNESAAELIDVVGQEMKKLADTPVSAQELEDAKSYLVGSVPLALSSTDNIASIMMSLQTEGLPATYLDHYEESIRKVTIEDIQRVAARLLDPAKMTIVMVGKPAGITPTKQITEIPNAR
jgi:zinc protease